MLNSHATGPQSTAKIGVMSYPCGNKDDALFAHSLVEFFSHFAVAKCSSHESVDLSLPSNRSDSLGLELLSRHPSLPPRIATEGLIPTLASYLDKIASAVESASAVRLAHSPHDLSLASNTCGIPQAPATPTMPLSSLENIIRQADPPGPRELYRMASSLMLSAFNVSKAVKGAKSAKDAKDANVPRIGTDRPTIPKSSIATSPEYVFATFMFGGLWYCYGSRPSVEPIVDNWCSWLNDRIAGARAAPIKNTPWLGASQTLFTADTEADILATLWTFVSRGAGNLQPTGHQASFAEFYSMMALRAGVCFVAYDGTLLVDVAVVMQTGAQISNLVYDRITGDQRGAAIFFDCDMGKAWAARYLAAVRWYTHCSPSAMGLSTIASTLYAYTSKRHAAAYWKYVRPRLIRARGLTSSFDLPVCTSSFWYDGGLEGCHPPPLHPCKHHPQPVYDSPIIDAINAVSSITECETYEQWRSHIDTSVASVDSWMRDLANNGERDVLLYATLGASSSFVNLLASTLTAVLGYD
ncbi:uncharacterized protein N7479_006343 [Penicillium vulpinum]|uniref:Uncharacterized protein n=1 Tax=Penicillium vulpinum TaxID=29845 RepID=A0A1V6RFT4_9EURO|nr:uncharacterized protein N7479_006343 [Penicillium vulpinum]KAJ5959193.1 hypothetical protein N7479_006343 [Penicillium vulpinum]OQE00661.1 hypothetical protein PENVUL_c048G01926 [Penicillium vulpinum]